MNLHAYILQYDVFELLKIMDEEDFHEIITAALIDGAWFRYFPSSYLMVSPLSFSEFGDLINRLYPLNRVRWMLMQIEGHAYRGSLPEDAHIWLERNMNFTLPL